MKLNQSLLAIAAIVAATSAHADLAGHQVTGSLVFSSPTNFWDPAIGYVPAGSGNSSGTTVTLNDAAMDFAYSSYAGHVTADFTGGHLLLDVAATLTNTSAWTITFTSVDAGLFAGISQVSSSFSNPITTSISGNVLTLSYGGGEPLGAYTADFAVTAVPEPASIALMLGGLGLVGATAARRRKQG